MTWVWRALSLFERFVGRRRLWRLGRLIYTYSRRDLPEASAIVAEQSILGRLAHTHAPDRPWVALDVGAFVGRWSVGLLEHRPDSTLFAFEPTPASRTLLASVLAGRGEVVPAAVSDHVGSTAFKIHGKAGTVNLDGVNRICEEDGGETVPLTTLDSFCAERCIESVDVIKIDAEGHDLAVLRGASALLSGGRVAYIQFEYNHHWLATRSSLRDVFELTKGSRYAVGKITLDGVEFYRSWNSEMDRFFQSDYALVRDDLISLAGDFGDFDAANTYGRSVASGVSPTQRHFD